MATINERITYTIPNIEDDLTVKYTANPSYAGFKDNALDRAKRDLYRGGAIQTEPEMDERVKDWLADRAVLYLLDVAEDYYKSQSLSDTIDEHTAQFYDKIQVVMGLRRVIGDRVDDRKIEVADIVSAALQPETIPMVTSRGAYKVTQNPFAKARPWR
jgi:hypothetical protein